jgi:hypothetical protein
MYESIKAEARRFLVDSREALRWWRRDWAAPAAPTVKRRVLKRHSIPGATWVETGTYRGDTTAFLARLGGSVVSIEPDAHLQANATKRFADDDRIKLVKGTSEEVLEEVLQALAGPVCFWLDGHFSGAGTYRSDIDTPITQELDTIARQLPRLQPICVLVDDFREFSPVPSSGQSTYPTRQSLVEWAVANNLAWSVEHDIFIATTQSIDEHPSFE